MCYVRANEWGSDVPWILFSLAGVLVVSTVAAFVRRRRRGAVVITDFVPAELAWIDGPPTLNAFGATAYSRALARNAAHQFLPSQYQPTITYASGTPANVAIDSTGRCTAVANGTSVITAASTGLTSITQTATVSQTVASITGVSNTLSTDDASSGTFSPSGLDATGHAVAGATFAYAVDYASILSVNASTGAWAGQSAGTAHVTITASPGGAQFIVTATVVHAAGLTASPSSFSGIVGATQQEAFTIGATDVTSDVIAYSSDETIATISSAPDQPAVGAGTNPTSSTLDVPVTGTGPYGGTPTTVALEVYNGTSWVRQTAVSWTGGKTATQTVTATGLSASTDYTGKIRAVTSTSAGDSSASSAIPSGTTAAGTSIPTGLSGVAVVSDDMTSYASTTALRSSTSFKYQYSSQVSLATSPAYNGHNVMAVLLDGVTADAPRVRYDLGTPLTSPLARVTYTFPAGFAAYTSGDSSRVLSLVNTTVSGSAGTGTWDGYGASFASLEVHSDGNYHVLIRGAHGSGNNAFAAQDLIVGAVGAEFANGYTVDYFLEHKITTTSGGQWTINVWMCKKGGTPMLLNSKTVTPGLVAQVGSVYWQDFMPNTASETFYLDQCEVIDESVHPDPFGLASVATPYTPLT